MTLVFEQRRLKYAASLNDDSLSESTDPDFEVKYVDIGNVDSQGNINELALYPFKKAPSRARRQVKHGDVIISTVRTYLQAIAPIKDPEPNLIVSTGFAVARPNPLILSDDYFKYAARESYFLWEVQARSKGVSYPAINSSELADILISLPPIEVQQQIANYIDRETTEIDTLVAEKEQMITLLEENREVLIRHTVTRGLNPNASFKSSGVDWIGDIPEYWEVSKVKYLTKILRGKFSHRPRNDPKLYDGEYPFIQTGDVANSKKFITEYTQTLNEYGYAVSKEFPSGTLLMTIAANIGDMAILDFNACFPDSIVGFIPSNRTGVLFLYYLFVSMRKQFLATAVMNTQLNLNVERISNLVTVIPPLNEQIEIINCLDEEIQKIDRLSANIQESIALLKERRSALITAAVTGQIELEDMKG